MSLAELIWSDLERFTQSYRLRGQSFSSTKIFWESFLFKAGFQAVLLYRISHWLFEHGWIYPAWFFTRINVAITGAEIEFNAQIGPGLFITHPVGIVIGRGAVIGSDATIFQGVSLVVKSWRPDEIKVFPLVGHGCFFFAHSMVIGGITIGDRCVVGAGAMVRESMPEGALAVGSPATILPGRGEEIIRSWEPQ